MYLYRSITGKQGLISFDVKSKLQLYCSIIKWEGILRYLKDALKKNPLKGTLCLFVYTPDPQKVIGIMIDNVNFKA